MSNDKLIVGNDVSDDFRSELLSILQRCLSGGVVRSWEFLPNLVVNIVKLHEKYEENNEENNEKTN